MPHPCTATGASAQWFPAWDPQVRKKAPLRHRDCCWEWPGVGDHWGVRLGAQRTLCSPRVRYTQWPHRILFVLYHTLLTMLGNTYVGFRNESGSNSLLLSPPLLPLLSLEGVGGGNPPQSWFQSSSTSMAFLSGVLGPFILCDLGSKFPGGQSWFHASVYTSWTGTPQLQCIRMGTLFAVLS